MADTDLVHRLAALPNLAEIPKVELGWLGAHGQLEVYEAGEVLAPKGEPVEKLWVILSGHVAARIDRGSGSRLVMGWGAGEVSGMLPYSRMTGPPGDNYAEDQTEVLTIHTDRFPEMIHRCPKFTAYTVHLMLDRARSFNASDLQDEKMIALGKLSAGLAHEINNPASAIVRGAKLLLEGLPEAEAASRAVGSVGLNADVLQTIGELRTDSLARQSMSDLSPIQRADREEEIATWLDGHDVDASHAGALADSAVAVEALDALAEKVSGDALELALRWMVAGFNTLSLASDIGRAGTRIHELVGAVKRFTHMDNLAGPESVDVAAGLRDTVRVLAGKARSKAASITLDVEPDLPRLQANAGELNQIWMNLLDNGLDAVSEAGTIDVVARTNQGRVVVQVVDDGSGIPEDVLPRIFDPFFTTKPPGQGTGLGLEITRRLVRRYHGDISVESRPGRTEFRVSFAVEPSTASP